MQAPVVSVEFDTRALVAFAVFVVAVMVHLLRTGRMVGRLEKVAETNAANVARAAATTERLVAEQARAQEENARQIAQLTANVSHVSRGLERLERVMEAHEARLRVVEADRHRSQGGIA